MIANSEPIYVVMVCENIKEHIYDIRKEDGTIGKKPSGFPDFTSSRIVAFYHEKENAIKSVKANNCDMWETCYDYAIVEQVSPGMYPITANRWVFKFNTETKTYEKIKEPEILKHISGITIG